MQIKGMFSLIGYALLIGSVGFFARVIEGLDLMTVVFFRALLAAGFIAIYAAGTGSLKDLRPNNIPVMGISALFQGLMMLTFIGAALNTTIANAVFITNTAPIFAVFFSQIFLKEKISTATLGGLLLTTIAVCLIVDVRNFSLSSEHLLGDMLALASSVCYAAATVSAKKLSDDNSGACIAFWQMGLTALALTPFITMPAPSVLISAAIPLFGIGVVASGIAFLLFQSGVKNLPAQQVHIITSLGIVIPAGFAWLLLGEPMSTLTIAACALILIGVIWVQTTAVHPVSEDDFHEAPTRRLRPVSISR
ncbi:MAG: DMT family transporter [Anaerolineae bacterium]